MSIRFLIQEHKNQKMKSESTINTEDVAAKLHIASLEAQIKQLEQDLAEAKKSIKSVIQHYEDGAVYFERNYEAFYTESFQDLMVDIYKKHDEAPKESSK